MIHPGKIALSDTVLVMFASLWILCCDNALQEVESFELDHLDFKTVAEYPYLEGEEPCKHIYIYHSQRYIYKYMCY